MAWGDEFVDALMTAPVGAALLARFEREQHEVPRWLSYPCPSTSRAVHAAADRLETISYDEFLEHLVFTAYAVVGPWMSDREDVVARSFADARGRSALARVISDRFADELHAPMDSTAQQWWRSEWPERSAEAVANFGQEWERRDLSHVYGAGQFSVGALWTVGDMPIRIENDMAGAWELYDVISRWRLPVRPSARVVEIHRPADWAALTKRFPSPVRRETDDTKQRAQRAPDWPKVAEEFDGVHLSWAGMLTADHVESDLGDGSVAWLRYWFTERTHWLRDVFGDPTPLPAPVVTEPGAVSPSEDPQRYASDLRVLFGRLGRL